MNRGRLSRLELSPVFSAQCSRGGSWRTGVAVAGRTLIYNISEPHIILPQDLITAGSGGYDTEQVKNWFDYPLFDDSIPVIQIYKAIRAPGTVFTRRAFTQWLDAYVTGVEVGQEVLRILTELQPRNHPKRVF